MDVLIDPNVSFVLLVAGSLVAGLALLAPGTGLLEIGALFTIALAGYGIINLPVNWWATLIILAAILPIFLVYRRPIRRQALLISLSSLVYVIGCAFLFRGDGWLPGVNFVLVVLLAPIVAGITWLFSRKLLEAVRTHPVFHPNDLVGMTGQTTTDIQGKGSVYVNGENWTAYSKVFIPAGSQVRVVGRNGLTLEGEPLN